MNVPSAVAALIAALAVASCAPAVTADDLLRKEFAEACFKLPAHKRKKERRRTLYCACVYDQTMRGLSDKERSFAQFYLLQQVRIDVLSKNLIDKPEFGAMVKASKAIGAATGRCR